MLKTKLIELFMFIPFLARLLSDTNSAESRRVENILKENKIPYRIDTKRARGSIGTALDTHSYARSNLAMYKGADTPSVVYAIYVRRKDLEQAKALITKKIN